MECSKSNESSPNPKTSLPLELIHDDEIIPITRFPPLAVFDQSTTYPAIEVPVHRTAELRKTLSSLLMHRPKIKNVYPGSSEKTRKLVLANDEAIMDERIQELLQDAVTFQISNHTSTTTYADLTVEEVLRKLLPSRITELPAAFEIVGSIAHLNLREDFLPYKFIIGKVILDKNQPRIKTVVNKLGSIANEYRTFGMEVIAGFAGENWSLVTVKEERCQFQLDFQNVYWNSRLSAEHKRLVGVIQKDATKCDDSPVVVADLMAGVGPFAVPLTAPTKTKQPSKRNPQGSNNNNSQSFIVHANDLNPSSYKFLKINGSNNKCPADRLFCYNQDARAFCHYLQDQHIDCHHVIMNLPAIAPEFLDAFRGFVGIILPRVHVYCFAPKPTTAGTNVAGPNNDTAATAADRKAITQDDVDLSVTQRCSDALGCRLEVEANKVVVKVVRDVSPKKNMVCISFDLPEEIRQVPRITLEKGIGDANTTSRGKGEPISKRAKLVDN